MNYALHVEILKRFPKQWVFAQRMEMPEDKLSKIIHEKKEATEEEKAKMAKVLGVKVEDIFGSVEND